jgi:hypothetical protein
MGGCREALRHPLPCPQGQDRGHVPQGDEGCGREVQGDDRLAEIWTDKKTLQQIMVAFREDEVGTWPVAFEVLDENTVPTGAFDGVSQELLAERRKAALRSAGVQPSRIVPTSLQSRKQVA